MSFQLGLERCIEAPPPILAGSKFGLLLNQASVDGQFRYAHHLLAERFPGQLKALFGPQHGLWSEQQDNMIETPHARDPVLGVPVYSLYAESRKPAAEMLEGLDVLVVDLQDVGTRVYTYIWTLSYCLEACKEVGIPLLVLDRPNPLGGEVAEGPVLDPAFASFVGRAAIPMRHGLSMGEMALYLNQLMGIGAEVEVLDCRGWTRDQLWSDLGRAWVPTSPNLPRFEGVLVYPGQVLIEGTQLSEGRGTTTPFEICGAPFIDPEAWLEALRPFDLPGVALRPIRYEPTFQKAKGKGCGGLFLHPTDAQALRSYELTLALLATAWQLWPADCAWLQPPYEYEAELMPFDILSGDARARETIQAGADPAAVRELAALDEAGWWTAVGPCLRYGS